MTSRLSKEQLAGTAERRNRLAHDTIEIGSVWQSGPDLRVIAILGSDEINEDHLRGELAFQREGTRAAVRLVLAVDESLLHLGPDADRSPGDE